MTQQRLNNLMVLHVHNGHTDNHDLVAVANDFIEGRKSFFGPEFKKSHIYMNSSLLTLLCRLIQSIMHVAQSLISNNAKFLEGLNIP